MKNKLQNTLQKIANEIKKQNNPLTDRTGDSHFNKVTKEDVSTPHVHEKGTPGGVRPAEKGKDL